MWRITGRDANGRAREVRQREVPFANRDRIGAAMHDLVREQTRATFDADMARPDPLPGVDGIDQWGRQAAAPPGREGTSSNEPAPPEISEADLEYLELPDAESEQRVPALRYSEGTAAAIAFHERQAVVADVTGLKEIEVTRDQDRYPRLPDVGPTSGRVEFRQYAGRMVTEGEAEFDASFTATRFELPDGPDDVPRGLVTRFLQTAGSLLTRPIREARDPMMWRRLRASEARYSAIARNYPDIGEVTLRHGKLRLVGAAGKEPVLIFIHGTMGCALPALAQLSLPPYRDIKTFRFEHDTFRNLTDNAEDLVAAVKAYAPDATQIFLAAHSRGGLVARYAAATLGSDVEVLTFGTPHLGTPIAIAGTRAFNLLVAAGRTGVGAVPNWDPVTLASKIFLAGRLALSPPAGISAMIPGSSVRAIPVPARLRAWGGMYNARLAARASRGVRYAFAFANGAFKDELNDVVVGTESALGAGQPANPLFCNHFEYFGMLEVQNKIFGLMLR
jgi:pimeloyl-ACP methyl ester carboxylesterase